MPVNQSCGLEQARTQLPRLVASAHAGVASIITRHGKPMAAIVSLHDFQELKRASEPAPDWLALRGSGRGLWGRNVGQTVATLRDEWSQV
jgi:prevent-host-death family protein